MSKFSVKKLINSKIQKFINISLTNEKLRKQIIKAGSNNQNNPDDIDVYSLFRKNFDDSQIEKKLRSLYNEDKKRYDDFFDNVSFSSNHLIYEGIWNESFNDQKVNEELDLNAERIESIIPQDLQGDEVLLVHLKQKQDFQKQIFEILESLREISEESKLLIKETKDYAAYPQIFDVFYTKRFEGYVHPVLDGIHLDEIKESVEDTLYDPTSDFIEQAYRNLIIKNKKSNEIKKQIDSQVDFLSRTDFKKNVIYDLEQKDKEILATIVDLNTLTKEDNEKYIEKLKVLIKNVEDSIKSSVEIAFVTTKEEAQKNMSFLTEHLFYLKKELKILENHNTYLSVSNSALSLKIEIAKIDEEIKKYVEKSRLQKSKEDRLSEIKKVLLGIDDEEVIKKLDSIFVENNIDFNDISEYLYSEIMQSITTDPFDTIDIYKILTDKRAIRFLRDAAEQNQKVAVITNLVGKGSVNPYLSIEKTSANENEVESGKEVQRFGLVNQSHDIRMSGKYFHINDLIYGDASSTTQIKSKGVNLAKGNYNKKNPLMSHIMILDSNLKASKRNELELSVFLNSLSTIELSKSNPYFNIMFILPDSVLKNGKVYRTSSITQFLDGTPNSDNKNKIYNALESKYNKQKKDDKVYSGVRSNMSLFSAPQTLNNFDDIFVGRKSSLEKEIDKKIQSYTRSNYIHDTTRPFMTIKSFSIDVAPTQGLLSMKSGKISLVLHDRTRMIEIAPFVKPDLFGAFGAELLVEYGWNNIEGQSEKTENVIGEFIDSLKTREKYIITNSSFTVTKNGEVDIDLSVAMKGPIDIKNTFLTSDSDTKINVQRIKILHDSIEAIKGELALNNLNRRFLSFREELSENIVSIFVKEVKEIINSLNSKEVKNVKEYLDNLDLSKSSKDFRDEVVKKISTKITLLDKINVLKEIFMQEFIQDKSVSSITGVNEFFDINDSNDYNVVKFSEISANLLTNYYSLMLSIKDIIENAEAVNNTQKDFIDKRIIKPIKNIDPFFDRDWKFDYSEVLEINERLNNDGELTYISLGAIVSSIVGTHMKESGKYDDIQIVTYNVNDNAGLMGGRNISSLLVKVSDIKELSEDIFFSRSKITLEGFLSRIIEKYIESNAQICYGLSDLYIDEEKGNTQKTSIDERLEKINSVMSSKSNIVQFQMPKIKMFFDTFVKKESAEKTILRITLYDENDNPYRDLAELFTKDNLLISSTLKLNRVKAQFGRDSNEFKKKSNQIFKDLVEKGFIKTKKNSKGEEFYQIDVKDKIMAKREIKSRVPSITYGSQNSGVIDANVTTINEGNLSTVLMTRNDQRRNFLSNLKVTANDDLPLQILPSKASITMFGCPIVNFSQYLFLDFETGTTIDNFYTVTGLNHNLAPGNFTTNLTLSYGDAYGKYVSAITTTENLIKETVTGNNVYVEVISDFEEQKLSSSNIDISSLNSLNYIIENNKGAISLGQGTSANYSISSKNPEYFKIKENDNVSILYAQKIVLTGKGNTKNIGSHLGSVVSPTIKQKDDKLEINLIHYIFRSENKSSVDLIPNYRIIIDDVYNMILKNEDNVIQAIAPGPLSTEARDKVISTLPTIKTPETKVSQELNSSDLENFKEFLEIAISQTPVFKQRSIEINTASKKESIEISDKPIKKPEVTVSVPSLKEESSGQSAQPTPQKSKLSEHPPLKDFKKHFPNLRMGYNLTSRHFYNKPKVVYLYDLYDLRSDLMTKELTNLNNLGFKLIPVVCDKKTGKVHDFGRIENKKFLGSLKEGDLDDTDDKITIFAVELPQIGPTNAKDYIYKNVALDTLVKANDAIGEIKSNSSINTKPLGDPAVITSAYRGVIYQQHIRNTGGDKPNRSLKGGNGYERDLSKFKIGATISGVASVAGSQHKNHTAIDLKYTHDYSDINSINNLIEIMKVFIRHGFMGLGFYSNAIHIDRRDEKFPVLWVQNSKTIYEQLKKNNDDTIKRLIKTPKIVPNMSKEQKTAAESRAKSKTIERFRDHFKIILQNYYKSLGK